MAIAGRARPAVTKGIASDWLASLHARLPELSRSHRTIARYVLSHIDDVAFITAGKLADRCKTSEATTIRFAQCLGFAGFPDFQAQIRVFVRQKLSPGEKVRQIQPIQAEMPALLKQVTDNSLANARETLKQQSTDAIVTAARLVIEAETMYVIGLRGSSGTAQTFGFVFSQLRPQVRNLLEGGPVLLESLVSLSARDTVLAISVPRYTRWTIDALHHARRKGARTIVITDSAFSPAAQVADIALVVQIDALFSNSYAPVLLLLDVLAAAIFSIQPEAALARLDAIERMFDGHDFFFQAEDLPTMNAERRLREFSSFASARGSRQTKRQT